MASDAGYSGEMNVHTWGDDFNALEFIIDQLVSQNAHVTWGKVVGLIGGAGAVAAAGTVNVQPLANMLNGQGQPTPHGVLYGLPYYRMQGGTFALIADPAENDIGLVLFADRDMSSVKATKAQANPGSRRRFDMADGVFIGGILNALPVQYFQIIGQVLNIVFGSQINLNAPTVATSAIFEAGNGASGTFTTADSKTVTVSHGIITSIV